MKYFIKKLSVALWMVFIYMFSSEVSTTSSTRSGKIVDTVSTYLTLSEEILTFLIRKSAHLALYFILGVLVFSLIREYTKETAKLIICTLAVVATYAVIDETHQMFVSGRSGEIRDVLIDVTGAAIGIGVYYGFLKYRPKNKRIINTKDSND